MINMITIENTAVLFVSILCLIIFYFKWSYKYWERKKIPYLNPNFPFGNLENPLKLKTGITLQLAEIYAEFKRRGCKHGGIYSFTTPIYLPIDLEYVQKILVTDFQYFTDRGNYYNEKTDPSSANLYNVEDHKWKKLRTKLSPIFTAAKIKSMFQTILDCGEQMKEVIDEKYLLQSKTLDMKEIASCYMSDAIGSCIFGMDCNNFKNLDSPFRRHCKRYFGANTDRMVRNFLGLNFPKICKLMGMRLIPTYLSSFLNDVVKDVITVRENSNINRNDFIQLVLEMKKNTNESLTVAEISAQSLLFFLAGFETSSNVMSFCLYELAQNENIQDKLRQEINDVVSKHHDKVSYECIQEMSYMNQVIEETLRKYPPGFAVIRVCTQDYKLPRTDIVLEKGTRILIPLYGIHHDPEYYPNPQVFDPERFSVEAKASRHTMSFLGFGEGPRICIGMRFGQIQTKIGLTLLLRRYKFSLNSKMPKSLTFNTKSILLSSVEDILLDIEKV